METSRIWQWVMATTFMGLHLKNPISDTTRVVTRSYWHHCPLGKMFPETCPRIMQEQDQVVLLLQFLNIVLPQYTATTTRITPTFPFPRHCGPRHSRVVPTCQVRAVEKHPQSQLHPNKLKSLHPEMNFEFVFSCISTIKKSKLQIHLFFDNFTTTTIFHCLQRTPFQTGMHLSAL